jgi:polyisoprenoid-binding protein YceI
MVMVALLSGFLLAGTTLSSVAASTPAPASEILQFDSANSTASFSVKVFWMIPVDGQFGEIRGQVVIDRFRGQARVTAHIDANGVSMRRSSNENWVKSEEFFDVSNYPNIHFRSDSFPLSRLRSGGELPGTLDMRGAQHPVVFTIVRSECARPAIDCPVLASGEVRRSAFGMRTRRATLSDKVELGFSIRVFDTGGRASPR